MDNGAHGYTYTTLPFRGLEHGDRYIRYTSFNPLMHGIPLGGHLIPDKSPKISCLNGLYPDCSRPKNKVTYFNISTIFDKYQVPERLRLVLKVVKPTYRLHTGARVKNAALLTYVT